MPNTVWTSDRLVYRAANNDDDALLLDLLSHETNFVNATLIAPVPLGNKHGGEMREMLNKGILGVIVCLKADEACSAGKTRGEESTPLVSDATKTSPTTSAKPQQLIPIGFAGFHPAYPGLEHHRNGTIGIQIVPKYQNQGYGTEVVLWLLNWGFQHANLHRIDLRVYSWNSGAIRLYEKLGFQFEGRQREALWFNGRYHDMLGFAILDREWRERYGPADETQQAGTALPVSNDVPSL